MIEELLPKAAAAAETRTDEPEARIFPQELRLIEGALPRRRAEFTAARVCAHRSLAALGVPPVPVLGGAHREPLWPQGVVGSLTHCAGYRGAAVARSREARTLGIDAEPDEPLPGGVLEHVSLPAERARLARSSAAHPDRLLFSAKESVYKAWFPLAGSWLGFQDAEITLHPGGTFQVRLLVPGPVTGFRGRWLARGGLILTAVAAPP